MYYSLVSVVYTLFIAVWFRLCGFCYIFYSLVNIVYACYIYYSLVYVACAKCTFIAARCISVLYSLMSGSCGFCYFNVCGMLYL